MTTTGEAGREHVYLTGEERRALAALAHEHAASRSFVLRVGLRLLAGLEVPREVAHSFGWELERRSAGEAGRIAAGR